MGFPAHCAPQKCEYRQGDPRSRRDTLTLWRAHFPQELVTTVIAHEVSRSVGAQSIGIADSERARAGPALSFSAAANAPNSTKSYDSITGARRSLGLALLVVGTCNCALLCLLESSIDNPLSQQRHREGVAISECNRN